MGLYKICEHKGRARDRCAREDDDQEQDGRVEDQRRDERKVHGVLVRHERHRRNNGPYSAAEVAHRLREEASVADVQEAGAGCRRHGFDPRLYARGGERALRRTIP